MYTPKGSKLSWVVGSPCSEELLRYTQVTRRERSTSFKCKQHRENYPQKIPGPNEFNQTFRELIPTLHKLF